MVVPSTSMVCICLPPFCLSVFSAVSSISLFADPGFNQSTYTIGEVLHIAGLSTRFPPSPQNDFSPLDVQCTTERHHSHTFPSTRPVVTPEQTVNVAAETRFFSCLLYIVQQILFFFLHIRTNWQARRGQTSATSRFFFFCLSHSLSLSVFLFSI